MDMTLALKEQPGGLYTGEVSVPLPGVWDVRVTAGLGRNIYIQKQRLFIQ
jgi:nitrogen fixation protein FixH